MMGRNRVKSPHELFGIECGVGWKTLYEPLILLCKREKVEILQIKEKFGTLRFYVGAAPEHVHVAIDDAESRSAETCELCGAPGKLCGDYWMMTRCAKCAKKK